MGGHYRLMFVVTVLALEIIAASAIANAYTVAAPVFIFLMTLVVQWLCIEPPDVSEQDLH